MESELVKRYRPVYYDNCRRGRCREGDFRLGGKREELQEQRPRGTCPAVKCPDPAVGTRRRRSTLTHADSCVPFWWLFRCILTWRVRRFEDVYLRLPRARAPQMKNVVCRRTGDVLNTRWHRAVACSFHSLWSNLLRKVRCFAPISPGQKLGCRWF